MSDSRPEHSGDGRRGERPDSSGVVNGHHKTVRPAGSTLPDLLFAHARARPDAQALVFSDGEVISYVRFASRVQGAAEALRTAGVNPGDICATYAAPSPGHIIALWALWRCRAVAAPLSTRLPVREVRRRLDTLKASHLIVDQSLDEAPSGFRTVIRLTDLVQENDIQDQVADANQPATLIYTSGSTARPKPVLHSFGNHYFSAEGSNRNIPLQEGDRWLLSLPLYHVGGLAILFRCVMAGAAVALQRDRPSFQRSALPHGVSHLSLVSTQLRRLVASSAGPPADLKAALVGGGPTPRALLQRAHTGGWPIHTTYGLTEMTSQVTTSPPDSTFEALSTAGFPLPHRDVRIGTSGEIMVRGRTRFIGYHGDNGIEQPFDREGWYSTGDLGEWDKEGRLIVRGRRDNLIISGGENIQPEEIESVLCTLPGVCAAVVVGIPSEDYGERPVAFVQQSTTQDRLEGGRLAEQLRQRLPSFKVPDAFYEWTGDRGALLKPQRAALKEEARRRQEDE